MRAAAHCPHPGCGHRLSQHHQGVCGAKNCRVWTTSADATCRSAIFDIEQPQPPAPEVAARLERARRTR